MTNKQKIEALEKGIKSSVTPEPLKEKMRTQLAQLKALEKESTSDKKPKFKVGDVVVLKGETTLEKEITSYKQNSKGEFVYKAKYVSKPEATGEWNEEEIEIFVLEKKEKPKKLKPSSATPIKKATRNYYRNKEIKSVTVLENGKKVTYAGKDVFNGANFFKEGGALVSKAKYVPVRNIVEVTFEDGSKDKPRNGYHIKNGATPIMEHGGPVELPEGSFIHYQNYYLENGGNLDKNPVELKGYRVNFYKSHDKTGSNIVSDGQFKDMILVTDGKSGDSFSVMSNEPHLMLVERTIFGKKYLHVTPVNVKAPNSGRMFGGNFVWSSDSRFRENVSDLPLPLHDRVEVYEKGGKVGRLPKYVMDFKENDYKKMVQDYPDYPFYSVKSGNIQEIFSEKTEELVAKWNSKKKELTVYNPKYNSEVIVWLKDNSFLTQDQVYEIDEMFEEEEYKLGGQLLSAWKRERKYVNKSEDYEVRYAKGKNRKGYKKLAKGGEVGDYAKVPVGYNMTHYGLIKKVITNDVLYPENGYEIAGIGDVLHPEQFEIISSSEFNKLKKQGTEVKPNHFLIIEEEKPNKNELFGKVLLKIRVPYNFEKIVKEEFDFTEYLSKTLTKKWFGNGVFGVKIVKSLFEENFNQYVIVEIDIPIGVTQSKGLDKFDFTEFISKTLTKKWFGNGVWGIDIIETFEKGGVLSKGDEVYIFELRKNAKVISIKELNDFEDEIVVELADGTKKDLRSSEVMKAEKPKVNPPYNPNLNLTEEEWKAKHNIQNYGKGGKTEKGQGKGAIFAVAKEIRKPGEKWQDAVARAGKLNK